MPELLIAVLAAAALTLMIIFSRQFFHLLSYALIWVILGALLAAAVGEGSVLLAFAVLGLVIAIIRLATHKKGSTFVTFFLQLISAPFYALNALQRYGQRLWRPLLKDPDSGFCRAYR